MWHTALWSCTHIPNIIDLSRKTKSYGPEKKILFFFFTLRSKVKVPQRSLRYVTHHLMVMHPNTKYNWPISKDKNVMVWTRKYYLKNNYLILRTTVKVPRRSLRYVTHRLMVMHPHTKYHWPIWKDKNVMAQTRKYYLKNNYLTLRTKVKVPWKSLWYVTHCLMVMHPHTK
jgi:acyl-CoA thioesterase FadM